MAAITVMQVLAQTPVPAVDDAAKKATEAAANATWITPETLAAVLVTVVGFATFFALMRIGSWIAKDNTWSLADALSEEVEVGTDKKDATGNPVKDNNGNIAKDSIMKASSSRLIALLGSIAIMMLYIGAGLSVLHGFVIDQKVPEGTKDLTNFFVYGMVLFAPYVVNKFASIFGVK